MRPRLDMDRDEIGAGLRESVEIGIAGRDHQMHVEEEFGMRPQRRDDRRPDRDVRHEMTVHHIDMDPVGAGGGDGADFFAEIGEIGGQDRGRDDERAHDS